MNLFQANLVAFGDSPGLGAYEVGHFLQHKQYLQVLAAQGDVGVPDWDIRSMHFIDEHEFVTWLSVHETIHVFLRQRANVGGVDLSYFDPQSAVSWGLWQEAHRYEHGLFDQHFGTT